MRWGGVGAGVCGGESKLKADDVLKGFGGGVLNDLCCLSAGGCGETSGGSFEMGTEGGLEDEEPVELVDGGFGGAMGGGFRRDKSSSFVAGGVKGGFGAGIDGG